VKIVVSFLLRQELIDGGASGGQGRTVCWWGTTARTAKSFAFWTRYDVVRQCYFGESPVAHRRFGWVQDLRVAKTLNSAREHSEAITSVVAVDKTVWTASKDAVLCIWWADTGGSTHLRLFLGEDDC
jgi:hypothetical protein